MDYQGNTNKAKEEAAKKKEKHVERVVRGEVVEIPLPIGRKFKNIFMGADLGSTARFVAADILLPALRNLFVDIMSGGSERIAYGETRRRPYRQYEQQYGPRISYDRTPLRRDPRERAYLPDQRPRTIPSRESFREPDMMLFPSRDEAEMVLERISDLINQYDVATLGDFYVLCGLKSSHVDEKWGWSSLSNVEIIQERNGYRIRLPRLEEV